MQPRYLEAPASLLARMVNPRIELAPTAKYSRGREAIEVAERAGLILDDWQQYSLERALRIRARGKKWAAFEVGVNVARQNGKGGILEARELAGLFAFGERLIVHSAHQFDTSLEAFRRLLMLIEDTPEFDQQVRRVSRSHGEEGIELKSRQRIRFRTRTKGGGRGFSGDCLILDEAMFLPEMAHGALLPTLSARKNPQVWYTGSAVDQQVHEHGIVFARVRDRGLKGEPELVYLEWSADGKLEDVDAVIDEPEAWQQANPALGIRITEKHVAAERRSMDARTFAVERLGIGDWPPVGDESHALIDFDRWRSLTDARSRLLDPICLAFDVTPSRDHAVISAAGRRLDDLLHLETVDHRRGTGWLPARLAELVAKFDVASVSFDPASPASALVRELEGLGVEVTPVAARDHASACGFLFDQIDQGGFRHLGTDELAIAVKNASTRPLGDSWAWSRRKSAADIGPLVAGTLALWQASEVLASVYDERGLIAV